MQDLRFEEYLECEDHRVQAHKYEGDGGNDMKEDQGEREIPEEKAKGGVGYWHSPRLA